jgi:hypothetical protein
MSDGRQRSGGERAYRGAVRGFSLLFLAVGIVVLVVTLTNGGGPLSVGFFMGLAFIAVGAGRLWLGSRLER